MAYEKIHEYLDSVTIGDVKGNQIYLDTDTGTDQNGWTSKKLDLETLSQIVRTYYTIHAQFMSLTKQVISSALREQQVAIENSASANGIYSEPDRINGGTLFVVPEFGVYRVQFILQIEHAGGAQETLGAWLKIDGQNVNASMKTIEVQANTGFNLLVCEQLVAMDAGSNIAVWMYGTHATDLALQTQPQSLSIGSPAAASAQIVIHKF